MMIVDRVSGVGRRVTFPDIPLWYCATFTWVKQSGKINDAGCKLSCKKNEVGA